MRSLSYDTFEPEGRSSLLSVLLLLALLALNLLCRTHAYRPHTSHTHLFISNTLYPPAKMWHSLPAPLGTGTYVNIADG